jgi:hypothetical protein
LEIDGKRAAFAGLGLDGKLLNDYLALKNRFGQGALKGLLTGGGGYLSSVALKTVPYYLTHSTQVECEVRNGPNARAYRLGPDGLPFGEPLEPGALLFRGPLMMAAAATIPYYGFAFRMFPFAGRRRGMMHLRLVAVSTTSILMNLRKVWKGKWFAEGIHDFHAHEIEIHFARPMPLQIGGDPEGYRDQVKLAVAPEQIELVDFTGAMH